MNDNFQKKIAYWAVMLMGVGFATGIWSAAALTGMVKVTLPRMALGAHLTALMGGFWLLGVSYTRPFLSYDDKQFRTLGWLTLIPAWGNWVLTLIGSFLGVNGLSFTGDKTNDFLAVGLQLVVVVPALAASVYWARGFSPKR